MSAREPAETATTGPSAPTHELAAENERLRARLSELERELVEIQGRADTQVARMQEQVYWLDRWHLDLNALMRRRGMLPAMQALRSLRLLVWRGRRSWRALQKRRGR